MTCDTYPREISEQRGRYVEQPTTITFQVMKLFLFEKILLLMKNIKISAGYWRANARYRFIIRHRHF